MPRASKVKKTIEITAARVTALPFEKSLYVQNASSCYLLNVLRSESARFMDHTGTAFNLIFIALSKLLLSVSLPRLCGVIDFYKLRGREQRSLPLLEVFFLSLKILFRI